MEPTLEPNNPQGPSHYIRSALNRRLGPIQDNGLLHEQETLQRRREERERIIQDIYQLYQVGNPSENIPIKDSDIQKVVSVLRRLQLIGKTDTKTIIEYCAKWSAKEANPRANLVDPLQIRHLLSYHEDIPHEEMTMFEIVRLRDACERRNPDGIRNWFTQSGQKKRLLPKDTPAFLKHLLIELWNQGNCDLELFVFEQAVLDVRLFGPIGWENTRLLYSILKHVGGADCNLFNAYLTADEIEEAIKLHDLFQNVDEVAHFRELKKNHRPEALAELEAKIMEVAQTRDNTPPDNGPKPPPPKNGTKKSWSLFGFLSFQGSPS